MVAADLLVLGSSGRVGRLLRGVLSGSSWLRAGFAEGAPRIVWQYRSGDGADVLKWQPGRPLPRGFSARVVVALWGVTSGPPEALAQNAMLARAALHLARRVGAERVLHLSSAAVQAGLQGAPAAEDLPPAPLTAYGEAKLRMEEEIAAWHGAQPGTTPRSVILRMGNVAGADALSVALDRGGPVVLDRFPDGGGPRRSYIGPEDLARLLACLATCPLSRLPACVNVTGPRPVAMADLVRAAGRNLRWRPAPPSALPVMALDPRRMEALTGELTGSGTARGLVAQWHRTREVA
ncbi:dTDP-4-dehydrorhamnose reductase [Pseudooceanicola antarcticus]|uniref:NAD(P)-dependent oxidoreductase n=1 Tax=Pseudooceanicola antarcticus TaxID=1247613 RepID=A0A285HUR0_9RHOB|nr:NAD(P)-dependent oxidoreductase [Pseudooceanicola antarcticus]SNY39407.1 dTDP-4-dehydrorhamnose reductase [Pseudooceanicola antarcticus]